MIVRLTVPATLVCVFAVKVCLNEPVVTVLAVRVNSEVAESVLTPLICATYSPGTWARPSAADVMVLPEIDAAATISWPAPLPPGSNTS